MLAMTLGYNEDYSEEAPEKEALDHLAGYALVEFGAPWCPHCQVAMPIIESLMKTYPTVPHVKVLDGKGKRLGRQFGVKQWPNLILLKDGQEIGRWVRMTHIEELNQAKDMLDSIV
ncbi:Thioredoxin domain-containing protein [Marinomonas posidonica IVIA-Po-181]|uniref:Thioredoxin domain-containing protein n=2 Tax=Marinomonas TaxID=28253 RepID=F6CTC9_MARPP|nr:Thioredoxin domain-containing protein [Marinomonas posidonica IVIA-Po-181]